MNRMYEFMMKLQDMFSPQLMKMANTYGKVVGSMERKKSVIGGIFSKAGQSVDELKRKLFGLSSSNNHLRLDSSDIDSAIRKAGKLRDSMGRFIPGGGSGGGSSGGRLMGGFRNMMSGGALGGMLLGGLGGYIGLQGLEMANSSFIQPAFKSERNQFSTGVMLGSEGAGKALMDQLAKYAADNPVFDKPEVQAAGQLFVGVSEQLERIIPRLSMLGDVAAGSGNDLLGLTTIIAKVKAQGRVQGDELMQLMERRINILPELAKVKGVGQGDISKLVSKGLVSYEDVMAAFARMTGESGMYHNMGSRIASETEGGKYNKVLGNLSEKAEEIGIKLLPYVTKVMQFIDQILEKLDPLSVAFKILKEGVFSVGSAILDLVGFFDTFGPKMTDAEKLVSLLSIAINYVGNAFLLVGSIIQYFVENPILMAMGTILGLIKLWYILSAAFTASPIGFVIIAIAALVVALMTAWDKVDWFREGLIKMWETAKNVFKNLGDFMFKLFIEGDVAGAVSIIRGAFNQGQQNGMDAVVADRNQRLVKNVPKAVQNNGNLAFAPGGKGSGKGGTSSLDSVSGLSTAVGGTKSNVININVGSLIAKSEINVMDFQGDVGDLESKIITALSRLINSANQIVVA